MGSVMTVETEFQSLSLESEIGLCACSGSFALKWEVDRPGWVENNLLAAWRIAVREGYTCISKRKTIMNAWMSWTSTCQAIGCLVHNLLRRQHHKDSEREVMLRDTGKEKVLEWLSTLCACGRLMIKHEKPASWGTNYVTVIDSHEDMVA